MNKSGLISSILKNNTSITFQILSLICILLSVILTINSNSKSLAQTSGELKTVLDFVVMKESENNCVIYAVDGSASLYRRKLECNPSKVSYGNFEKVKLEGNILPVKISALANNNNLLYLADSSLKSVFTVDVNSFKAKVVLKSSLIVSPVSLALSPSGKLVMGQDEPDKVLFFDTLNLEATPWELSLPKVQDIYRIIFVGENLLVFNRDKSDGRIYFCQKVKNEDNPNEYKIIQLELDESFERLFERTDEQERDIAFINNYLYLTTKSSLWAWKLPGNLISNEENLYASKENYKTSSSGNKELELVKERLSPFVGQNYASNYHRLSGFNDLLTGADNKRQHFSLHKLTPIRISGAAKVTNEILTKFYKIFFEKGLVPEREITALKSYDKFEDLLFEEKILFSENVNERPLNSPGVILRQEPSYKKDLNEILCKLNQRLNNWTCDDSRPYPVSQTLNRRIEKSQALVIPDVKYTEIPDTTEIINLSGQKTVQQVLESRFKNQSDLSAFSDERLMRNIAAYLNTFDYEMTQRGFVIRTRPMPNTNNKWNVGSFIKIDENRIEKILPESSACNIPESGKITDEKSVRYLSQEMTTYDQGIDYLPGYPVSASALEEMRAEFRKMGISKLEVEFENPKIVKILRPTLNSEILKSCLSTITTEKTLFVADIFYAEKAKYKLRGFKGEKQLLTANQIKKWNLVGVPDQKKEWSLIVDQPMVIGYRPIQLDGRSLVFNGSGQTMEQQLLSYTSLGPEAGFNWVPTVNTIKPGSSQDIRGKKEGAIRLPVKAGEVYLLVDSGMLASANSPIGKLIEEYPENVILPTKSTTPQSLFRPISLQEISIETVKQNRVDLMSSIKFSQNFNRRRKEVVIGLMEENIEQIHPDFFLDLEKADDDPDFPDTTELVWSAGNIEDPNQRLRMELSKKPGRKPPTHTSVETDHGTHIAGLLSSNNTEVPGLVPFSPLVFINTAGDSKWSTTQIVNAIGLKTTIFNFSQGVKEIDQLNADLMDQTIHNNSDRLFVVAAGNGDRSRNPIDLNLGINIPAQVKWEEKNNNVLVVSAIDFQGRLLKGGNNCGTSEPPPINYGWKYVHLLAPGCNIFSSISDARYAPQSGTSQAVAVVTAVAALLKEKGLAPQQIIARLLYTAEWIPEYDKMALGGKIHAGRALENTDKYVLKFEETQNMPETRIFEIFRSTPNVEVRNFDVDAKLVKSLPTDLKPPPSIPFDDIYRITFKNNRFRVIYLDRRGDNPKLMILENADLKGRVTYFYDPNDPNTTSKTETKSISAFRDYIRKIPELPSGIKFR